MAPRRQSAGVLLVRTNADGVAEFLLVHPGGPFWAKKDAGAWSIPKGEHVEGEDPQECARREFREELGVECPVDELVALGDIVQSGGKTVHAWCGTAEIDTTSIESNTFEIEWPPRSGRMERFPEVDRAGYFDIATAAIKIIPGQRPFLERALGALRSAGHDL
jgi:predicted NUDIX family NTP pyrophosphohydrolase